MNELKRILVLTACVLGLGLSSPADAMMSINGSCYDTDEQDLEQGGYVSPSSEEKEEEEEIDQGGYIPPMKKQIVILGNIN